MPGGGRQIVQTLNITQAESALFLRKHASHHAATPSVTHRWTGASRHLS